MQLGLQQYIGFKVLTVIVPCPFSNRYNIELYHISIPNNMYILSLYKVSCLSEHYQALVQAKQLLV